MAEGLQDAFDELIPGAASKANLFLQVIKQRSDEENIGLTFAPREMRKTRQLILEATIQMGGTFLKGAPMKVIVHADPVGSSLQVGWQLTQEELGGIMAFSDNAQFAHANRVMRNLKPENQRKLSGILQAFHRVVFMPVLHQLVEAMESGSRPQGGRGFLNA